MVKVTMTVRSLWSKSICLKCRKASNQGDKHVLSLWISNLLFKGRMCCWHILCCTVAAKGFLSKKHWLRRFRYQRGRKTTLNLKRLNDERSEPTIAIDWLQVGGAKDSNTQIKLPRIFTLKHLPVDKKEVATPKKIEKWDYLKTISPEMTKTADAEVGLLIGANCMKVLVSLMLIASNNGEPYAYQTCLRWCIVKWLAKIQLYCSARCNKFKDFRPPICYRGVHQGYNLTILLRKKSSMLMVC